MDEQKHWPGPWRWQQADSSTTDLLDANGDTVLSIYESHGGGVLPDETCQPLIAAAPDLLEALKAIEWVTQPLQVGYGMTYPMLCAACGRYKGDGHNAVCRVAAAIAKAEGRS